ncbi:MAG: tetratricopeptide repeat protein [Polyangiaceae bacterium]
MSRSLCTGIAVAALLGCALPPPASQRALLLADQGQEREAITLLDAHLAEEPRDTTARRLLVRLLGQIGNLDAARDQAEQLANVLGKDSPEPWLELGAACELAHRYEVALRMYDYAASVAPLNARGPKRGGMRALRWAEFAAAEPRLEEAVRRDPADPETWHALGLTRLKLGRLDAARDAYASGMRADPSALENRLGLATVALRAQDPQAALREYDALIAARPSFADAYLGKSWSLILLGRLSEAEQALALAETAGGSHAVLARQRRALAGLKRSNREPAPSVEGNERR